MKIKLKDIPLFCGTGICSIVFFNFCYFQSIEIIGGAAIPALLLYTAPIFVMFMSLFLFKENITVKKVIRKVEKCLYFKKKRVNIMLSDLTV